jgi:hypothetical protein
LTPRQSDVPSKIVGGFFLVAFIGLLMLFAQGYHTLVLILIGVLFVIGALTFTYDRSTTLSGLALVASSGILSLIGKGYHTPFVVITIMIVGLGALAFLYHLWQVWYPDEHIAPLMRRYAFRVLQILAVALAYVQVRASINLLTGVDPGSFPAAQATLTVLLAIPLWLLVIPLAVLPMLLVYLGMAYIAGLRQAMGFIKLRGISPRGWAFRAFGAGSLYVACLLGFILPAGHASVQRAARIVAAYVLVVTQFSYDHTCAVSSKEQWVARLQDRKAMKASMVSIADIRIWHDIRFTTGTCEQAIEP